MPYKRFHADLKKAGLSDKEAAVYLASLSLGPASVQTIARRAKVARATTYLVLDALKEMDLISSYQENGKIFFVAASPLQLEQLLVTRELQIQEQKNVLKDLIPELNALMKSSDERPVVRYYEGFDGLKQMRSEMAMYSSSTDIWYNITPIDKLRLLFREEATEYKPRVAKKIKQKTIFTTDSQTYKGQLLADSSKDRTERKFISPDKFHANVGMTIYKDRVALGVLSSDLGGVIIESEPIAQMMQDVFEILWEKLE